uniref:Integrase, catalytic region, zinc finger, CCHC-type, peptidase aspartic, catalytic n=1 Tax=Tanacetum cinerariifolium TaxID=118510 RepID=A0A699H372_TANCI|nr:integrase, catalytic region, zinc finger, CCHC-type, peptidase aspartic, catalytic [Tanacetum cinerariifolium]
MHNNIMSVGSRDRPPMLATGRYAQWRSQFLRYIDIRPNGDALRKCILEGPYTSTTVVVPAVPATDDSRAVPEHTTVERPMNMSPENKARYQSKKEAIHLILTGIGDEIYSIVDACKTAQEMWEAIERNKGKEISKPITPPSESDFEEDSDPEQAHKDKDMQKNLALIAKTVNVARARENHKEKMLLCKQAEKGVPFQAEQSDWLAHMDEEINEQELEAHYSYMEKIQEVPTADSGTYSKPLEQVQNDTGYNVFANELQHSEQSESINNTCIVDTDDSNVILDSPDMCDNDIQNDQNDVECENERAVLTNLIAHLKLDVDENKRIQKQLKKANTSLAHELKQCKSILVELTEFKKYKDCNNRTVDYDKLERKLNDTLGLLAQKDIDIKEGLKLKAYKISVVKEKHNELVKQSLLTKSHYEGLLKEKIKVITDLKQKEDRDIDKMISMEKQLQFINKIVYKRNQTIQTIHMLVPKGLTFNGRPTFANPRYLKKAQSEKPCLYEILNDQSDHTNRLIPDREETLTLAEESRSKLNKDFVRPYDYTKLNSLYKFFKPAPQGNHEQLAHANEVRKKIWRKSFVKVKPNIFKNIDFLPNSKSISKIRQAYNVMTNNINHFKKIVDQTWVKHSMDHISLRPPIAHDIQIIIKTCLMPLDLKTQNDSFAFVHELKQEMHADLKYVESLEKEIDELESDKAEFSNMYDTLLQECVSNDVMCSYLHSLSDLDFHTDVQCLYLHKVKECECLEQKLSKQTESKLIEKMKGKSVDTKFEKPSILGKPPLQPIRNQPVVRQPTAYKSEWSQLPRHRFASQVGVSHDLTKLVTLHSWPHIPRESVGSNDMLHNYYLEKAKKKAQLQKDKVLNTKPSVQQSARLPNTANGNKPKPRNFNQQPRNWPPSMSSRVSNRTDNIVEPPRNQKIKLSCMCTKKDAQSLRTTKRYMPIEKKYDSKKHDRQIPIRQKLSPNKSSTVYLKTMPSRSCLRWKPTGRNFKTVGLRWVPTGKIFTFSTTKVDSEPPNGSNEDITNHNECEQTLDVSAGFKEFSSDEHAMTSDHNSSELGIHDHNNEQSSSTLFQKLFL